MLDRQIEKTHSTLNPNGNYRFVKQFYEISDQSDQSKDVSFKKRVKSDFVKEFWWGVQTCLVQVIVFLLSFLTMTGPVDHLEVDK